MSILLALLSTFSIGLGEFLASGLTQRVRANQVTSTVFLGGAVTMAITALFWRGDPTGADLAYGAAAGAVNAMAILLLYLAYSRGSLRSAAPAAAVVMSGVPVLWDLVITGTSPSPITSIGLLIGVVAIALSSYDRDDGGGGRSGLLVAVLAGMLFGTLLVLLSYIGEGAGGSVLLVQRSVGLVVAVAVAGATGPAIFATGRSDAIVSFGIGVLASVAVALFVLALRGGSLAVVSVVSSQYAAVAVLLGVVFRGQRMTWWQVVGLLGASAAVALIAIG